MLQTQTGQIYDISVVSLSTQSFNDHVYEFQITILL